jgi:diadenosine tetraphosphate (Ap4A) HIT family hydrolase
VSPFRPDPAFESGSVRLGDLPLCEVRLQDDARFGWLILIPRRAGLVEIADLAASERAMLLDEAIAAGEALRGAFAADGRPVDKINIASIGNVTAQLHVHVVARWRDDPLWPDPVWGRPGRQRRMGEAHQALSRALVAALGLEV